METTTQSTAKLLWDFAHQRPGVNSRDYVSPYSTREQWAQEVKNYRREVREISRDLQDFVELYKLADRLVYDLSLHISKYFNFRKGDRLSLSDGKLYYVTGQYFPTEFRPATCRVLARIVWEHFAVGAEDAYEVRRQIRKRVSRRVYNNYFN